MQRKYVINSPQVRSNAARAVSEIKGADNLEVIIQPHRDDKTAEQRGWFHVLCKILGEETGYTKGEVKELVKKAILGTKIIKIGEHEKEVTESSEDQDKIGYSELIDGIYRLGAEAGIALPNPRYRGE